MATAQNHLIALLPKRYRDRLLAQCETVDLVFGDLVCEAGKPLRHVYFPINGFISLLAIDSEDAQLEVGMVGREGMLGVHHVLGVAQAPLKALVQGAGLSLRMASETFRAELKLNPPLQAVLSRYIHVCMQQLASSAVCLRFHELGPRLARWLLMTHDRAHSDEFHVTQEFLSSMLGVRRVGVNAAARALQSQGLIIYHRGDMQVLDRARLEATACSCFAKDTAAYAKQLS